MDPEQVLKFRAQVEKYLGASTRLGGAPLANLEASLQLAEQATAGLKADIAALEQAAAARAGAAVPAPEKVRPAAAAQTLPDLKVPGLRGVRTARAADICRLYSPSEPARTLLHPHLSPSHFLQRLIDQKLHAEGLKFLAHALPIRDAVWWGCLCLRSIIGPSLTPGQRERLKMVAQWVLEPAEDRRRAAQAPAEELGMKDALGCLLMSVFCSGGSLTSPPLPHVPMPPGMAAQALAGAVLQAATQGEHAMTLRFHQFLDLGIAVANGSVPWK